MKRQLSLLLLILCFVLITIPNVPKASEIPQEVLEDELIRLLQEPIQLIVGANWFRGDEKILEIKQDKGQSGKVYVTVQVVSFQGPHNPPYMEEIITFKIAGNRVKPTDYYNRTIPENEWNKFKCLLN